MTRARKIGLWIGGGLIGLIVLLLIAGVIIVQTDWFRSTVRQKIVAAVEEGTGGRVEIGSFAFDWTHLRAEVRNFVIHGLEPPDVAPLFRANLVRVDLKLLSPFKGFIDIAYLLVDTPQANVIVSADGRTNVPTPKTKKTSNTNGLETVVDLAVGRFELRNGLAAAGDHQDKLDLTAQNLRAQLAYNPANPRYTGELAMSPLYLNNLHADLKLPVTLEKDRISLSNAQVTTPKSKIVITGALEHMAAPRATGHVNLEVALDEVKQVASLGIPLDTVHGPGVLKGDINAAAEPDGTIRISNAQIAIGRSRIEASGTSKQIQFQSSLALDEIGRLLQLAQQPEGTVRLGGNAVYQSGTDYRVNANLDARNVAFRQGTTRIAGVALDSAVSADPHRIALGGLRLSALGGSFAGSAEIEEMDRYRVSGNLNQFDIDTMLRTFAAQRLGYDGVISGPVQAEGSLKNTNALAARARLSIAPGPRGIPVSGQLNADYNGGAETVALAPSYIALPHTRLDVAGALGSQVQVRLVSHDLRDFRPVAPDLPIAINRGGAATVTATVNGSISAPHVTGQVLVTNFAADGRPFTRLSAGIDAANTGAAVRDGLLARDALQARFSGSVGLRNWKPENPQPVRADVTVRNADLQDVLALAGQSSIAATGALTLDAHVNGTIGDPRGNADLNVANGTIEGERYDALIVRASMTQNAVQVPTLLFTAGPSRIEGNAVYNHPPGNLENGDWRAHIASNQVQLAQFQSLVKDRPGLRGVLGLNADAAGHGTDFPRAIQNLNANLSIRNLEMEEKRLGDLTATAQTAGQQIQYNVTSDFAGSTIRVDGRSLLTGNYDTTATAQIAHLPVDRVLAVAGRRDIPISGVLGANAQVSGTMEDPHVVGNVSLTNGKAYDEPFTRIQSAVQYSKQAIVVNSFRADAGTSTVEASGSLQNDRVQFHVRSNQIQLASLHTLQNAKPGLAGGVEITADGAATLPKSGAPEFSQINANVAVANLSLNKAPLGDATLSATTQGREAVFSLTSNLAKSDIRGSGRVQLTPDYPVDAKVTFNNVTYSGLSAMLGSTSLPVEAGVDGVISVAGPVTKTEALRGTLQLTKLEAHSAPSTTSTGVKKPRVNFELHNDRPIEVALDRGIVTVRSAHITGPYTDLNVSGTAPLHGSQAVNLRADGNINLEALEAFSANIFSAGAIVLNAAVTGTTEKPVVNGRLQLKNASFNMVDVPNGLTNGNGQIAFNGSEAVIESLTGESGGGKISLSGFAAYGGPELQFRIQANADAVSIAASSDISTKIGARLTLTGSTSRSLVSGTVTIHDVAMHSHSDVGSILTSAAAPPASPKVSTGLLANMRFDLKIQTAPDTQFRTTLTQNLQADANLTLRGNIDHPGMLGRVTVTEGEVVFFGYKYSIDQGTVTFFDPNKIEPVLNVDLSTTVQGVDVSLSVSGPVERMKFSYRSDPPLQFTEIVSLLASGKAPTSDPVLAAREPVAPQQSIQQAGASTLLGQAVANPVSGRLQRLFGVSKLKIDPQITGASNTPQATLTLQQQISRELTFTYIQDVTQSNPTVVRVEWAINPQWSAIAARDVNGQFDVDVFYKKRF
jgi:translocation and assembly module TamB